MKTSTDFVHNNVQAYKAYTFTGLYSVLYVRLYHHHHHHHHHRPKFHLARHVTSRHDSTRSTCRDERVERVELCLFRHVWRRTSYIVLACTSLVVCVLTYTNTFFPTNEWNKINVYSNKLVNNLHIITLYKLYNKLSCESRLSRSSRRACRAVSFDKLDTAKMHGLDTSKVSCRVETWRATWNLGYNRY